MHLVAVSCMLVKSKRCHIMKNGLAIKLCGAEDVEGLVHKLEATPRY